MAVTGSLTGKRLMWAPPPSAQDPPLLPSLSPLWPPSPPSVSPSSGAASGGAGLDSQRGTTSIREMISSSETGSASTHPDVFFFFLSFFSLSCFSLGPEVLDVLAVLEFLLQAVC